MLCHDVGLQSYWLWHALRYWAAALPIHLIVRTGDTQEYRHLCAVLLRDPVPQTMASSTLGGSRAPCLLVAVQYHQCSVVSTGWWCYGLPMVPRPRLLHEELDVARGDPLLEYVTTSGE